MNILEGTTLYLGHQPLEGDLAKHLTALTAAAEKGTPVGFSQGKPPRLLITRYPEVIGEKRVSDKLLELLAADILPNLIQSGTNGLIAYYLLSELLEQHEWASLNDALAVHHSGTPATQEEVLPLPGFSGNTPLYTSEKPLTQTLLGKAFSVNTPPASAHTPSQSEQNEPQVLRDAIQATDLPALVAHYYPGSGAKSGVEGAVKAVWRGDENPSFSLFRSDKGGTWRYRDHATGEAGTAFGFLVDILQLPKAEAAAVLVGSTFTVATPNTSVPIRQPPVKGKLATKKPKVKSKIVKTYAYTDEHYRLLFEVVRFFPKRFAQRRRDPETGAWVWGLKAGSYIKNKQGDWVLPKNGEPGEREFETCCHVLYHLPQLLASKGNEETVYLVEGEKDVETLESFDLTATCNPMGSLKWEPGYTETLQGRRVVNLLDNDEAGRKHSAMLSDELRGATDFSSLLLPDLPPGGDVTDWFDMGHSLEVFSDLTAPVQSVSEASYEEMQQALWQAVNTGTVQPFVHPLSNMELSPSNAHFCLKDALETPYNKDSRRVIDTAYNLLPNTGTPQTQEGTRA